MYKSEDVNRAFDRIDCWLQDMFIDDVHCQEDKMLIDNIKSIKQYIILVKEKLDEEEW